MVHQHKFIRRNTIFMGQSIRLRACKSCHRTQNEHTVGVKVKDSDEIHTFHLPAGSVLPHIQRNEDEMRCLMEASKGSLKLDSKPTTERR